MNYLDIFIAVVYAGLFLTMQCKQWKSLYRSSGLNGHLGLLFAGSFLMATHYSAITMNRHHRRGVLVATIGMPVMLQFTNLHYTMLVNTVFVSQVVIYFLIGRYLVRKNQMHSF
jgi:hypothetical protein